MAELKIEVVCVSWGTGGRSTKNPKLLQDVTYNKQEYRNKNLEQSQKAATVAAYASSHHPITLTSKYLQPSEG